MDVVDWNLVRSFIAVAEHGGLSAAARALGASQPTIGRHIAELEQALGVVLFRRGRSGYELTDNGILLRGHAQPVQVGMEAFSRVAFGATERIEGTIRITASEIISTLVLPEILARFARLEPGIETEVVASNQLDNLLRRDADIAIRMVRPEQDELIAHKIADVALTACAATSYLETYGTPQSPYDLTRHRMIGEDRADNYIKGFAQFGMKIDRHAFQFRSDNQVVIWQAIKAGVGIGIAQLPLVAREPSIIPILPEMPLPVLPTWLAMHKDVKTSPRIRRTADFLYEELLAFIRSADATRPAKSATMTKQKASVI